MVARNATRRIRRVVSADYARFPQLSSAAEVAWVLDGPRPCAYAAVFTLSGLPQEREVDVAVLPAWRRHGHGSALWQHAAHWLQGQAVRRVTVALDPADAPSAAFWQHHGFAPAFDEWEMRLSRWDALAPASVTLRQYQTTEALALLRLLYDDSFSGFDWYQPFTTDVDVWNEFSTADELLFLERAGEPIGFVWLRYQPDKTVELEPIGIVARFQGKGFGRIMVEAALHHARQRGIQHAKLTVRGDNPRAWTLYQHLGFETVRTRSYFAKSL